LDDKVENLRIELTNKIESVKTELSERINEVSKRVDENNRRIDDTNKRIDNVVYQIVEIKSDLQEALNLKKFTEDVIVRIERLESKVFTS
ncbi:MAG: hypothetical protein ACPLXN_02510, partial [Sulfurihydrogenibium sp.]